MGYKTLISLVLAVIFTALSTLAFAAREAVIVEIIDGDTAFMVDEQAAQAWWIVGECRRPIPLEKDKNSINSMTSEAISNDVTLGSHHIRLEQQFRFNLATTPASVGRQFLCKSIRLAQSLRPAVPVWSFRSVRTFITP